MSVEDRLYALVSQARQQHGDAFLRSSAQLVPLLSSQAPDLHAEIRALGSAGTLGALAATSIRLPTGDAVRLDQIGAIHDVTPQAHNGVRPPKPRRN